MKLPRAIHHVLEGHDLDPVEMKSVMLTLMSGEATPAQIAAFLVALRAKGETVDEVAAAAEVLRELSTRIAVSSEHLVDTCGTGGDGAHTFNISTTAAFVAAAAGARVAKHGSRSVSSRTGSADVLEAAGVKLDLTPQQVAACIERIGIGFLFAQRHHDAMKHAAAPRREIGVRTLFNLLGPLTNPAGAPNQLIGVFARQWVEPMARVLRKLGSQHVLVVHAEDGLDEISLASPTLVAELKAGQITTYPLEPERFGIAHVPLDELIVASPEESLEKMLSVLADHPGPARDIVVLNAGAAIYAANVAESLEAGVAKAQRAIADGSARRKLDELVALSHALA